MSKCDPTPASELGCDTHMSTAATSALEVTGRAVSPAWPSGCEALSLAIVYFSETPLTSSSIESFSAATTFSSAKVKSMQFKPHGTRFAGVADSKGGLGEPNLPTNQHNQWLACLAFKKKKRRRSLGLRRRASTAGCVMRGSELSQKEQRWTKGQTMLAEAPSSQELAVSLALKHRNVGFKTKYRIFVSSTKKILRYICRFATGLKRHWKMWKLERESKNQFTISGFIISGLYCIGLVI